VSGIELGRASSEVGFPVARSWRKRSESPQVGHFGTLDPFARAFCLFLRAGDRFAQFY